MAENKTKPTDQNVEEYLNQVSDERRRQDCFTVLKLMKRITGKKPRMWGDTLVGFGSYHYKYASGREGDFFLAGFSPRKQNLAIYIVAGLDKYPELLDKLGKFKTGKSCLYIKSIEDVDMSVLEELVKRSVKQVAKDNK